MINIIKGEGRTIEAVQLLRPEVDNILIVTCPPGTDNNIMKCVRNALKEAMPHVGVVVTNKHLSVAELTRLEAIELLRKLSEVV